MLFWWCSDAAINFEMGGFASLATLVSGLYSDSVISIVGHSAPWSLLLRHGRCNNIPRICPYQAL